MNLVIVKSLFKLKLWIDEILSIGTTISTNLILKRKIYKINFISLVLQILSYFSAVYYFLIDSQMECIIALSIGFTLFITFLFNSIEYFEISKFCIVFFCSLVCFNLSKSLGEYSSLHYVVLSVFCFPFVLFDIEKKILIVLALFNIFLFVFFQYEIISQKLIFSDILVNSNRLKFIPVVLFMFTMMLTNMYLLARDNELDEKLLLEAKEEFEKQISEARSVIQNSEYRNNSKTIADVLSIQINELKESEQQMQKNNFYLKRKNNDLDHFIYIASHDLKTPISNIEGLIMALNSHPEYHLNKDFRVIIEQIVSCSENFRETILKITDRNSYIISEEREELVYFDEVLNDVIKEIQIIISITNTTIKYDFNDYRSIVFLKKNLQHVFFNLITNSIKFRKQSCSPIIEIKSTVCEEGKIMLVVKDNGIGMSEEKKKSIESMLYNSYDYNDVDGSGMYVLKKMITEQLGRIEVESTENVGSEFKIYFNI